VLEFVSAHREYTLHDGSKRNYSCEEKVSPIAEPLFEELKGCMDEKTGETFDP
jgi:hypothetical protein